jgi:predicted PurR-regulated permease PerM
MINKKGLSNIVATVLIVLLVLAAIVLVWNVIKPAIEKTGESVETRQDCLFIDVKPLACNNNSGSYENIDLSVQVTKGEPTGVVGVIEWADGTTTSQTANSPGVLATALFSGMTSNPSGQMAVESTAAAIILDSDGNNITCEQSTPLKCHP